MSLIYPVSYSKARVDIDVKWQVSVDDCGTVQHGALIHLCALSSNDSYHAPPECEVLSYALRYSGK